MKSETIMEKAEGLAVWEAPAITEYDAKAEIQGALPAGPNEPTVFSS